MEANTGERTTIGTEDAINGELTEGDRATLRYDSANGGLIEREVEVVQVGIYETGAAAGLVVEDEDGGRYHVYGAGRVTAVYDDDSTRRLTTLVPRKNPTEFVVDEDDSDDEDAATLSPASNETTTDDVLTEIFGHLDDGDDVLIDLGYRTITIDDGADVWDNEEGTTVFLSDASGSTESGVDPADIESITPAEKSDEDESEIRTDGGVVEVDRPDCESCGHETDENPEPNGSARVCSFCGCYTDDDGNLPREDGKRCPNCSGQVAYGVLKDARKGIRGYLCVGECDLIVRPEDEPPVATDGGSNRTCTYGMMTKGLPECSREATHSGGSYYPGPVCKKHARTLDDPEPLDAEESADEDEDDVDRGRGVETDGGVSQPDVILFSNEGGKDHIGLASGLGCLCGYGPDGWVGRNAASDPDELEDRYPNICGTCLRVLRSLDRGDEDDVDRGRGVETDGGKRIEDGTERVVPLSRTDLTRLSSDDHALSFEFDHAATVTLVHDRNRRKWIEHDREEDAGDVFFLDQDDVRRATYSKTGFLLDGSNVRVIREGSADVDSNDIPTDQTDDVDRGRGIKTDGGEPLIDMDVAREVAEEFGTITVRAEGETLHLHVVDCWGIDEDAYVCGHYGGTKVPITAEGGPKGEPIKIFHVRIEAARRSSQGTITVEESHGADEPMQKVDVDEIVDVSTGGEDA